MSYMDFPPLQLAASYNLEQVLQQVKEMACQKPEPMSRSGTETCSLLSVGRPERAARLLFPSCSEDAIHD